MDFSKFGSVGMGSYMPDMPEGFEDYDYEEIMKSGGSSIGETGAAVFA